MALADFRDWLSEACAPTRLVFAKRLSGNDTLANGSHQAGPYVPRAFAFKAFPALAEARDGNGEAPFDLALDSHGSGRDARLVWYNNKLRGGSRNECRITRLGGASSPLLDPESTGALAVFTFAGGGDARCRSWLCDGLDADLFEEAFGEVAPGEGLDLSAGQAEMRFGGADPCRLRPDEIPAAWLLRFPSGEDMLRMSVERARAHGAGPDERIVKRRNCEHALFSCVEEAVFAPRVARGFADLASFVATAQSLLQARRSRGGNSLELHFREVLVEEGFRRGETFEFRPVVEVNRRPDFLFPSRAAYEDPMFAATRLRMLAVKSTCRDRWRQALNEASRVRVKHVLTLQRGVSVAQHDEMRESGIVLVVPKPLHRAFAEEIRPKLLGVADFLRELRALSPMPPT
ncbi:MAG: type II restriction endonuclease [Hyphomicrobiales bacterium]|nr:type II restriction endonuclease [Hyphomicrobiales bacterium]MDE2016916.1 type II restriction endonuclease [Hyphomicrobiales bacterium]